MPNGNSGGGREHRWTASSPLPTSFAAAGVRRAGKGFYWDGLEEAMIAEICVLQKLRLGHFLPQ